jgi:protein-S-isoprenylcysteine O-methyltransferase Ste14
MKKNQLQSIAADSRDPAATIVFAALAVVGSLGLVPEDMDPNLLAEIVGYAMALVAAIFSYVHHRDWKQALRDGWEARDRHRAEDDDTESSSSSEGPAS